MLEKDYAVIEKFVLDNLENFKTGKSANQQFIAELIEKIRRLRNVPYPEGMVDAICKQLAKAQEKMPQKSTRLLTLLFTLRKQIIHREIYRNMGISEIFPKLPPSAEGSNESFKESLGAFIVKGHDHREWIKDLSIVYVHGNTDKHGNIFGHALLYLGKLGYLHISDLFTKPKYIPERAFNAYLRKEKSFVIDIVPIFKDPKACHLNNKQVFKILSAIIIYADTRWFWGMTHHNCFTFAQKVAADCIKISPDNTISNNDIMLGDARAQLPLYLAMAMDQAKRLERPVDIQLAKKARLFFDVADNISALLHVGKQQVKNWSAIAKHGHARVDIVPSGAIPDFTEGTSEPSKMPDYALSDTEEEFYHQIHHNNSVSRAAYVASDTTSSDFSDSGDESGSEIEELAPDNEKGKEKIENMIRKTR